MGRSVAVRRRSSRGRGLRLQLGEEYDVLFLFFFFFKQKTAYEIRLSLVGSEMCIRDRYKEYTNLEEAISEIDSFGYPVVILSLIHI
ncbi:hypothetical protein CDFC105_53668 [Clostridioides difficile]|nr:hypothetical protein CDFC105_53668 [Clostridioides difficile]